MFGSFGMMELLLILIIVLIVFGAGKLPQLGEGVGKAIKGFKKSVHEADTVEGAAHPPATTPSGPPKGSDSSEALPPQQGGAQGSGHPPT